VGDYDRPPSPSPTIDLTSSLLTLETLNEASLSTASNRPSLSRTLGMNLRSATYVTAREVKKGALDNKEGLEDEHDVTTDSSNNSVKSVVCDRYMTHFGVIVFATWPLATTTYVYCLRLLYESLSSTH
jgi:hypothetical protein